MTKEEVRTAVKGIRALAKLRDHEAAHATEDELYLRVLQACAGVGSEEAAVQACELAVEALKASKISFNRLCS